MKKKLLLMTVLLLTFNIVYSNNYSDLVDKEVGVKTSKVGNFTAKLISVDEKKATMVLNENILINEKPYKNQGDTVSMPLNIITEMSSVDKYMMDDIFSYDMLNCDKEQCKKYSKNKYKGYIAVDGYKYNVGDTIILGSQTGSYYASQTTYNSATGSSYSRGYEASNYTTMYSEASLAAAILAGTVTYMSNRDGEYFIIKSFNVECPTRKNSTLLGRMEVKGYVRGVGGVIVENFDKALELGEIRALGIIMNRDIAIEKLKVAKEELDLGILSQEEYDTIKNDLIPYIKQK